jgi:hypothetical protein
MARVVLDIPNEKMSGFLQAILNLGIDKHAIASNYYAFIPKQKKDFLKNISQGILLFDWEFFNNELEFE